MSTKNYLRAYLWWCGDEVCNCYQPKIELVKPRQWSHLQVYDFKLLWAGDFHSEPEMQEMQDMILELQSKAREYGITLDEHFSGTKDFGEQFKGVKK